MAEPKLLLLRRAILSWTGPQGPMSNVLHFKDEDAVGFDVSAGLIVNALNDWWNAQAITTNRLRAHMSTDVSFREVRVIDFSLENGKDAIFPIIGSSTGAAAATALPPDLSAVISFRSGVTGGRFRGRMYTPTFTTSAVSSGGYISAAVRAGLAAGANQFITDCVVAGVPLVVYSRQDAGLMSTVESASVDQHWDVQRRRGN